MTLYLARETRKVCKEEVMYMIIVVYNYTIPAIAILQS